MRLALCALWVGCASAAPPAAVAPVAPVAPKPAPPPRLQETSTQEVLLAEVKKVIRSAQAEVRSCYEAILTPVYHPDVDLTLRLALRADGTVRRVDVVKLEPDVSGLIACFSGVLAELRFPKDREDWELEFPVRLRSAGLAPDVEDKTPPEAPDPS